jgi:hypothetical protein
MNDVFSRRTWISLWICLILLNVIMRIPLTPYEIGHDSFLIHFVADSISTYGYAKWWIHPLSIVGLYPFSMASALPFYLSGISQVLLLSMEQAIWVALLAIGIFSSFTAYLMAGAIKDDIIFKFITALVYSTSMGILIQTTWSASTRGLFLVFLPLFIYFLIKSRPSKLKYILFTVVLFIFLLATHNLFYFLIPIILGFVVTLIISKIQIKSSNYYVGVVLLILFLISYSQLSIEKVAMDTLIYNYARYIGVLVIFAMGGFIFLLFKNNKTFEESFTIMVLLFFMPFINIVIYSKFFMLPFAALLISYGIANLIRISQNRKCALFVMVIFIILSIGIAEFYQFGRTNIEGENQYSQFWAEESTVNAGLWVKLYTNKLVYTDDALLSRRIIAYSGATMLSESGIVYPIQDNLKDFDLSMRSPFSTLFYSQGPYHVENQSGLRQWAWYKLRDEGLDSRWGWIVKDLDINYFIKNEKFVSAFSSSSKIQENDRVFDNGDISIWNFRY